MGNFVSYFWIKLLNYVFKERTFFSSDFPLLNQPYAERVGKSISQENKIETSILIFTILTHIVTKSENHLEGIRTFLNTYLKNILNYESVFVKSRLCLFFGFFLDELFNRNKNLVDISIQFLLNNFFTFNQSRDYNTKYNFLK